MQPPINKTVIVTLLVIMFASLGTALEFPLKRDPTLYMNWRLVKVPNTHSVQQYALGTLDLDVYSQSTSHLTLLVSPDQYELLHAKEIPMEVLESNMQNVINKETERLNNRNPNADWFEEFHTYDEIKQWYMNLTATYPHIITYDGSIGKSVEGRDIFTIKLDKHPTVHHPQLYIQSSHHAREWIGQTTVQYIVYNFLTNPDLAKYLDEAEILVVPFVNPDGYEYTWTHDRQWRKSRSLPPTGSNCYGVDLNRNWNCKWGQGGSSTDPCSSNYMGKSVFSEPETTHISNWFLNHPNIIGAIDYHTSGELILRPYGYELKDAVHEEENFECGRLVQEAIASVRGHVYENVHSIELYLTTGTASDWFYSNQVRDKFGRRPYGWTLELTTSHYVEPTEILPVATENLAGYFAYIEYVLANPLAPDTEDPEGGNSTF